MSSTDAQLHRSKSGFSIAEVMVAVAIFLILSVSMVGIIFMNWNSYRHLQISNQNITNSALAMHQIVHGGPDGMWGLRQAAMGEVQTNAVAGTNRHGNSGWEIVYRLSVVSNMAQMVTRYDPVSGTISNNLAGRVAANVDDSYLRLDNREVVLGIQVRSETGGMEELVETRVLLRN